MYYILFQILIQEHFVLSSITCVNSMEVSYIPIAKARGFTTHWIKRALPESFFFQKVPSTINIYFPLIEFCSCRDSVIYHQDIQSFSSFFQMSCRDNHTTGIDSHHLSWRKIHDCDQCLSYQLFWLVVIVDTT